MMFNIECFLVAFSLGLWCSFCRGALVEPSVWPRPQSVKGDLAATKVVSPFLTFTTDGGDIATLTKAYERYQKIIFPHKQGNASEAEDAITAVRVKVQDRSEAFPQLSTNEAYQLDTTTATMSITADNVYGVLRALETLSQLTVYDFDGDKYLVPPVHVKDAPRYAHRGLLLDTSRHYQPVSFLKSTIDSMSYAKFNVLHWHAVDTESFPLESTSQPKLWNGAYTSREKYSRADVLEVVEYARERGVRVMIEFDMPGHAASWCTGYPDICPSVDCLQPLDPSTNATFTLINNLLTEFTGKDVFPDQMIHLGGDEVSYKCWEKSKKIQDWASANGLNNSEDIYKYFIDKVTQITTTLDHDPVQWVEVFEHFGSSLDKHVVVHVWKEKTTLDGVLQAGYRALLSNQDVWYLDHETTSWVDMYNNEPEEGLSASSDPKLILGGEACMWAENVDPSDLDATVWPRAAAISERLWTPKDLMDSETAQDRLETFRCLLTQRGIGAAPVTNFYARKAPRAQGSCYVQR